METSGWDDFMERNVPTPNSAFLEDLKSTLPPNVAKNIAWDMQNDEFNRNWEGAEPQVDWPSTYAAAQSFNEAKLPSTETVIPWFDCYDKSQIVSWDTEQVPKILESGKTKQQVATVDIVNYRKESIYSQKIYHATGSFKVNPCTKLINGFEPNSFDDPMFPTFETVQREVHEIFKNKLIISLGGTSDFNAMDFDVKKYDNFDLQSHWFLNVGPKIRQPHSLRSLSSHYGLRNQQAGIHTSFQDAVTHMELFHIYENIKIQDDRDNLSKRLNESHPYDNIKIIPSQFKNIITDKRRRLKTPYSKINNKYPE